MDCAACNATGKAPQQQQQLQQRHDYSTMMPTAKLPTSTQALLKRRRKIVEMIELIDRNTKQGTLAGLEGSLQKIDVELEMRSVPI